MSNANAMKTDLSGTKGHKILCEEIQQIRKTLIAHLEEGSRNHAMLLALIDDYILIMRAADKVGGYDE